MKILYKRYAPHFIWALILALLLGLMNVFLVQAGDPDDVIGGANPNHLVCIVDGDVIDLDSDAFEEFDEDELEFDPDIEVDVDELEDECEDEGGRLEYVSQTEIEGYVYEFVRNPENPDQWMAIPAAGIPVIAEGVTFEIFWISESNGYFYFYKTRFGAGPIVLNLRLPPDAHAINPDILIESTGFNDTWTVYLGFYRGDVGPEDIANLRTPEGASLPLGDSSFNDIVGLDGRSALPGVGGVTPEEESVPVTALAVLMVVLLPVAGVWTLRKHRSKKS